MTLTATDCDRCRRDIPYGETCYLVHTGETWPVDDGDLGKPIAQVVCGDCYDGPMVGQEPVRTVLREERRG